MPAENATPPHGGSAASARAGGLVAAGMMVMNVLVYGFTLISTRMLTPSEYGGLGALLGLLITASVAALALQATAARRLATATAADRLVHAVVLRRTSVAITLALTLTALAAAPAVHALLNVPWAAALLVAAALVPLTLLGNYTGLLQGSDAWTWLTAVFLGFGLGRIVCGGAALLISPTITGAMAGLAVGACVPAAIAWAGCRRLLPLPAAEPGAEVGRMPLAEVWRNAHLLLGLFTLTNLDVLLARLLFDAHASGLYAAGAILAKACLFLPQFVIIVAFPQMARDQADDAGDRAWLRPLALVGAIGAAVIAGTFVLRTLAVEFVGGSRYAELSDYIWWFAVEGTIFALLQMVVYRQIARHASAAVWWLWLAAISILAAGLIGVFARPTLLVGGMVAISALATVLVARTKPGVTR